jgi:uncharacterized protein YbgA (DUF1722 family)/uncharacterized protein YbbK (DUF523 family)
MTIDHPRPRVVVSRCLGFAACRYNGEVLEEPFVDRLSPFVEYVTVCPEVEIGLGTPRDPIRLVTRGKIRSLVQPATGLDVTAEMRRFSAGFLEQVEAIDGFILKSRSPSCGLRDARHYPSAGRSAALGRTAGLFGEAVLGRFPHLAVEDEARLLNLEIREHFLTRLFATARWRELRRRPSMAKLVAFHAAHKLLFMACGEKSMRRLGPIVANPDRLKPAEVFERYEEAFRQVFAGPPGRGPMTNVMMHAFGYFSERLTSRERAHFLKTLERYRRGLAPVNAPLVLLRSWIERFGQEYLERQVFFDPFPEDLARLSDSGRGREI